MDAAAAQISSGAKPKLKLIDKEDIAQPNKRPKLSTPRSKVCVICILHSIHDSGFYLYMLDLDDAVGLSGADDGFVHRLPNLRLDFRLDGLCVVGSTLFVFEGNSDISKPPFRKSVFAVDLSSPDFLPKENISNIVRLEKKDLKPVGVMRHTKKFPLPLPTHDGKKILIVSTWINSPPFHHRPSDLNYFDFYKDDPTAPVCPDGVDFELYDVETNSSTKLPRMPHASRDTVIGYAIDEQRSILHLHLHSGYMYYLDLLSRDHTWRQSPLPRIYLPLGKSLLIGKELYFCPTGVYDLSKEVGGCGESPHIGFPQSSMRSLLRDCHIALVGDDGREYDFCISQALLDRQKELAYLTVDVCAFDRAEYAGEEKRVVVRNKKTFKFVIGDDLCSRVRGVNVFPMS